MASKNFGARDITANNLLANSSLKVSAISGAVNFDGDGDFLSIESSSDLQVGSSDFTIEAWVYLNELNQNQVIVQKWGTVGNREFIFRVGTDNLLRFVYFDGSNTENTITSSTLSLNTWHHVVLRRDGTNLRMYLDGTIAGQSSSFSATIASTSQDVTIGENFNGKISNVRFVKGTAIYTESSFTVPTPTLNIVPGTSLLCCQSKTLATEEATGKTISITGNAAATDSGVPYDGYSTIDGNVNVTGILTAYNVSIGSSVTAGNFYGDGSGLSGVSGSISGIDTSGTSEFNNIDAVGVITATSFSGDGSNLTGVSGSIAGIDTSGTSEFNNIDAVGVITATSFSGDGSALTGISAESNLEIAGDTGIGTVSTSTQSLTIAGTTNKIETVAVGQSITLDFPTTLINDNLRTSASGRVITGLVASENNTDGLTLATGGGKKWLLGTANAQVGLYHNNNLKFETTSDGVAITGIASATSFSGDGSALTGISADPPVGIDTSGTSEFNNIDAVGVITATSFSGDGSGLTGISADPPAGINTSGTSEFNNLNVTGVSTFGSDSSLELLSGGNNAIVRGIGSGIIYLQSNNEVRLTGIGGNPVLASFLEGGSNTLYHNGINKFETTGFGATVYGTLDAQQLNVSGILTATSFSGDGSGLTGISADPPVGIDTSGTSEFNNIDAVGVITATSFVGDGSGLTGIVAGTATKSSTSDVSSTSGLSVYASHSATSNSALSIAGISSFTQVGILTAGNNADESSDLFGSNLACSADGKTIVVGATFDETPTGATNTGLVYVFDKVGNSFNEVGILTGSNAGDTSDYFGSFVAVSADGKTIAVGAEQDEISVATQGVAYIFDRDGDTFTEVSKVTGSTAQTDHDFGNDGDLSADGKVLVVAAVRAGSSNEGLVYVFDRVGDNYNQVGILSSYYSLDSFDFFGQSVRCSADGKTIVVGANQDEITGGTEAGIVYVFDRDKDDNYNVVGILTGGSLADAGDSFGRSVDISADGNVIAVGAISDELQGTTATGIVRVFDRVNSSDDLFNNFSQVGIFEGAISSQLGWSMSISADGNTIISGARNDDGPASSGGAVRVYKRQGDVFNEIDKVQSSSTKSNESFGSSVAISADGKYIYVGNPSGELGSAPASSGIVCAFNEVKETYVYSDTSGNIGIGLTNPSTKLDVSGTINATSYSGDGSGLTGISADPPVGIDTSGTSEFNNITAGVITATSFVGDGSALTNLPAADVTITDVSDSQLAVNFSNYTANFASDSATATSATKIAGITTYTQVGSSINSPYFNDFGRTLSMTADGKTFITGAQFGEFSGGPSNTGVARVYDRVGDTFTQVGILTGGIYTEADNYFGASVAASADGKIFVVGHRNAGVTTAGVAHVFERSGNDFNEIAILEGSESTSFDDRFGFSVACSADGRKIYVGSTDSTLSGLPDNIGLVYAFNRGDGNSYSQVGILTGSDAKTSNDRFGTSLHCSADGNSLVVGTNASLNTLNGEAYIFDRVGDTFTEVAILSGSLAVDGFDSFGGDAVRMSADGKIIAVGADGDELSGTTSYGLVYVFERLGISTTFTEIDILTGSFAVEGSDSFGRSVDMSADGNVIVVGASSDEFPGGSGGGMGYVFRRNGNTYEEVNYLNLSSAALGQSIACSADGKSVAIGDPNDSNGKIHVFDETRETSLSVDVDGNIGIGSEIPTAKLDVSGIVSATSFYGDGSNLTNLPSGGLSALQDDTNPTLGGTLDLNGQSVDGNLTLLDRNILGPNGICLQFPVVNTGLIIYGSEGLNFGTANVTISQNNGYDVIAFDSTPNLNVKGCLMGELGAEITGVCTATSFIGDGSALTGISADPPVGIDTSGTSEFNNITAGVITATSYYGDASNLTGITASTASKSVVSDKSTQSSLAVYTSHSETSNSAYDISGISTYTNTAVVAGSDLGSSYNYGEDLACSADGKILIVGADEADVNDIGAVYVHERIGIGNSFREVGIVTAGGGVQPFSRFGQKVACSADASTFVVGALFDEVDGAPSASGAAYVFDLDISTDTISQVGILTGSYAGDSSDYFGYSVDITADGKTIFVGAQQDEIPPASGASGVVYVFDRDGDTFTEIAQLQQEVDQGGFDRFGSSVSCSADGKHLYVGAVDDEFSGSPSSGGVVHAFDRIDNNTFNFVGIITGSLTTVGSDNKSFGYSIDCSANGDSIVVGARNHELSGNGSNSGVAFVFDRDGNTFNEVAILTGSTATNADSLFGENVEMSADGETIVVTSYSSFGNVYVFNRKGNEIIELFNLKADTITSADDYGESIAMSADGRVIYASASNSDFDTNNAGAVYVWDQVRETYVYSDTSGNIGIGSAIPSAKLDVVGDIRAGIDTSSGLILTSPNGTQYRLIVDDSGNLSTTAV